MTNMVESTRLHETEMLEWFQVEKLFEESGCVVSGKPEIRWTGTGKMESAFC